MEKLRVIPPFEFENWAVIALGGIPNKVQVGDMGVDGRFALIRLRDGSQRRPKTHWQQFGLHAALRIFLPILFPISQRRHGDFRVFRISPMHRLGVVAQRLLREPLRETAFQRPLRPRIPIAVQRHPGNPQPVTPLLELRRPIPGAHGAEIRKQLPDRRTPFQDGLNVRAEPEQRRLEICAA